MEEIWEERREIEVQPQIFWAEKKEAALLLQKMKKNQKSRKSRKKELNPQKVVFHQREEKAAPESRPLDE